MATTFCSSLHTCSRYFLRICRYELKALLEQKANTCSSCLYWSEAVIGAAQVLLQLMESSTDDRTCCSFVHITPLPPRGCSAMMLSSVPTSASHWASSAGEGSRFPGGSGPSGSKRSLAEKLPHGED
ncbi:hypothetical protein INR49_025307 [Caranx melampygus]|nr:hypothetical protein INR49_025307 [Caranx melampygus]